MRLAPRFARGRAGQCLVAVSGVEMVDLRVDPAFTRFACQDPRGALAVVRAREWAGVAVGTRMSGFRWLRAAISVAGPVMVVAALGSCAGDAPAPGAVTDSGLPSSAQPAPQEIIAAAYEKGTKASAFRFSLSTSIDIAGPWSRITVRGRRDVVDDALSSNLSAQVNGRHVELELVEVGSGTFVRVPGMDAWVKLSAAEAERLGFHQMDADPLDTLATLKDAGTVRNAGRETVEGVETTKYAGTIALDKVLATRDRPDQERRDLVAKLGMQNAQFIVYIDDEGWPARVIINGLQSLEPGAPIGTYLSMGMDYTGWDKPMSIKAPKRSVTSQEAGVADELNASRGALSG
jgi:hypothetical protein